MNNAVKLNTAAQAIVKQHKIVVILCKALNADDNARAKVGAALRKGDLTTTAQAVDCAHRCEQAIKSLGDIPLANGVRMSFGAALDVECIDADTRKSLQKLIDACAEIRIHHASHKEATVAQELAVV